MPTYSTSGDGGPVQQFWESTTPFSHHHSHNDLKVVVAPERAPARGAVLNEEMWECAQKTSRFQQHFKLIFDSVFTFIELQIKT